MVLLKFKYNDIVKWQGEVGVIKDSRIHNDTIQYLIQLIDRTEVWTGDKHIMRYTPKYVAKIGDKVSYYDKDGFKYGIVIDISLDYDWEYLVETMNRERYWKSVGEVHVYKS